MIKAIIVDCFGVLIGRGFEETYRTAGGDASRDRVFINDQLGQANLGIITEDDFHASMAQHLNIELTKWYATVASVEHLNTELLNYLKTVRPRYKTAILSNANHGVIEQRIGRDWLDDCFDVVVVSADVGIIKPDPDIYQLAVDRLGVGLNEAIFIDDRSLYTQAAADLGMQAILYRDTEQTKTALQKLLN